MVFRRLLAMAEQLEVELTSVYDDFWLCWIEQCVRVKDS